MRRNIRVYVAVFITVAALALSGCGREIMSSETAAEASSTQPSSNESETVKIENADDLVAFAARVNGGETTLNAILENDIDMSGVCNASAGSFTPMEDFEGEFDGNGHTIQNLYCVYTSMSAAPFVGLKGTVKNLRFENIIVEAEPQAAGIAVRMTGTAVIENCSVSGSVKGKLAAAGIATSLFDTSSIYDCVNEADVTSAQYYAAGIASCAYDGATGKISGCINRGYISGASASSGIFALNEALNGGSVVEVENCVDESGTKERTLENSEAKLIYVKENYAVAAFYGPDGGDTVNAAFCDAEGNKVGGLCGLGTLDNGWQLVATYEFPEDFDSGEIGVIIWDTKAERGEDGEYPSKTHLNIEQMTTEEMAEIGLDFLDGHCCLVGSGTTMVSGKSFGLTYGITWFDDYYFTYFSDIDGFADRFSYFAGDGTPLDEYFEGYSTLEITVLPSMFDVMLVQDSGDSDEEKQRAMCDELEACKPYVIYTGLDGTEQRFDLLTTE